mmetsp:Transcript_10839/g.14084  ORF Transcript_10839/g.14084 Transcript_10839/m.14084 type:complete len:887 (+) Transcript_10839:126-2786(+)
MAELSSKAAGRVLLPDNVDPIKYIIRLEPNLETFTFDGEQTVEVEITKPGTQEISLHTRELYIKEASFTGSNGEKITPVEINFNNTLRTCTFVFKEELVVGAGAVQISFMGHLNNQMAGFYRSKYTDINGNSKYMASTQFEALDARRCFPCWDEPAKKAVFALTLVVPGDLQAFANMPEKEVNTLKDGRKEIIYLDSPKMSTYLLAMCIGEFDFVQDYTEHGVLVRVYTPPGKSETGQFALKVACDTLDLYNNFFKLPYPLPKLDMVAIPEFAMGAMENWGLVTYREVDLLIDEAQASTQQKQRVCGVVTHELAHQWFGNLVTMAWWDDLWLNEGFASWTQTYAAACLFPSWKMWDQFTVDDQAAALRLDSLRTSHPIQVPIAHAEEVEQVFDAISYCKGASVVRMLAAVLGEENFQKGLQLYMNRHRYGNTETYHLWGAWEEVSNIPVQEMMKSWTEQMGYPVVEVVEEEWTANSVKLTLQQDWFLQDGSGLGDEKLWNIPLIAGSKGMPAGTPEKIMKERTMVLEVPLDGSSEQWVKLNYGQHIPMRVKYTHKMIEKLAGAVASKELPPADRAGLVMDTYALVKAGLMEATELLILLKAYSEETDATVWEALGQTLVALDKAFIDDAILHERFTTLAAGLVVPAVEKIGWEAQASDEHLTKLARATLIGLLSRFAGADPGVQNEARRRYDLWLQSPEDTANLPSEYKVPVLKIVLKNGGIKEFEEVLAYHDKAELIAEKKVVMNSIGAIADPDLKKRVLEWTMTDTVKVQDFFYPMGSVSQSGQTGLNITWEFFQRELNSGLKEKLSGAVPAMMDAVIVYCCSGFSSNEKADEIEEFFKQNPLPNNTRKISNLLETIRINAAFLERLKASEVSKESFWQQLSQH